MHVFNVVHVTAMQPNDQFGAFLLFQFLDMFRLLWFIFISEGQCVIFKRFKDTEGLIHVGWFVNLYFPDIVPHQFLESLHVLIIDNPFKDIFDVI